MFDMTREAMEKRLCSTHGRFAQSGAFCKMSLVDADDNEDGKACKFDEEHVGGV